MTHVKPNDIAREPSSLSFETDSFPDLDLMNYSRLVGQRSPPVSASPTLGLQVCVTVPDLCTWGLNLGPHAGKTSILRTEPSSWVSGDLFLSGRPSLLKTPLPPKVEPPARKQALKTGALGDISGSNQNNTDRNRGEGAPNPSDIIINTTGRN